jgi:hypothetical protein
MDHPGTNEPANVIPRSSGLYQENRPQFVHNSSPILPRFWIEFSGSVWVLLKARVEKAAPQFFAKFVMHV